MFFFSSTYLISVGLKETRHFIDHRSNDWGLVDRRNTQEEEIHRENMCWVSILEQI